MKIIYHFFGKNIFDHIIGVDDNTPPKPDPKGVLYIIDSLNLNSQECILVGDSEGDYQTAKNAGVKATPTLIINGELLQGAQSYQVIASVIDKHLG